jgi:hypothetical protein
MEYLNESVKDRLGYIILNYIILYIFIIFILGLVASHAYSILKFIDLVHPKIGNVKLVKLRNPWAKKEWRFNMLIYFINKIN